jgi:hypothetical protein
VDDTLHQVRSKSWSTHYWADDTLHQVRSKPKYLKAKCFWNAKFFYILKTHQQQKYK